MGKYEYRVKQGKRRYSWDPIFYYVERRVVGGQWRQISWLTESDKSEISSAYMWGHDAKKAIDTAKKLERFRMKMRRPADKVTIAYPSIEHKKEYIYVSTISAWWRQSDPLYYRLDRYKSVKRYFEKNPRLVKSVTAQLDGAFNVESKTENYITADFSKPFLLHGCA